MFELPVACVLLRHAQGNVLFDTGCHPDVVADPELRMGLLAKYMNPIMPADDHVLTSLKAVGLCPDDIDVVVCSHLHTDHCGCNEFFKKATIFVHALEIEAANASDAFVSVDTSGRTGIIPIPLTGHRPPDGCVRRRETDARSIAGTFEGNDRRSRQTGPERRIPARIRCAERPRKFGPENRTQKYPGRRTVLEISRRDSEAGSGRRADHLRP